MKLLLKRKTYLPDRVLGVLYIDGAYFCKTLEDAKREKKIAGQTCIKAGFYPLVVNRSQRFNRELPLLQNVPEFEGVRIHAGNTPADTQGCILLGEKYSANNDLVNSRPFEDKLTKLLKDDNSSHSIAITEE